MIRLAVSTPRSSSLHHWLLVIRADRGMCLDEDAALAKLSRRNDESSVAAARLRYLQRKAGKLQA